MKIFTLRVSVAVILLVASLICTALALPRTKALAKCKAKSDNAYDECCKQHNGCVADAAGAWLKPCADYANGVYVVCMKNYGYSRETPPSGPPTAATPPPSPSPYRPKPPVTVGNNPNPGSSPIKTKPVLPVSGPVTNKGPISSPTPTPQTIYAKPKPTQSPLRKEHRGGHHG
jgi:hypothetical protein